MNSLRKLTTIRQFTNLFNRNVAYKSAISLDTLYPASSLRITTPTQPQTALCSKFSGFIPMDQLEISYDKSSGPGGQNVNKVNTKVTLKFHIEKASWLDDNIKSKLLEKYRTKITKTGHLVFQSDLTRSQQLNLADCLEKVRNSIYKASYEPKPISAESAELQRQRQAKAARQRLVLKRMRSDVKEGRADPSVRDF